MGMNAEESKYPLYPYLSEEGRKEAQDLIDFFKKKMLSICQETLGDLYCDVAPHIESDSWTNYRNAMMAGFRNYGNRLVQGEHDFASIRKQIYKDFRDEIIKDLNQDLVERVVELERQLESERRMRMDR